MQRQAHRKVVDGPFTNTARCRLKMPFETIYSRPETASSADLATSFFTIRLGYSSRTMTTATHSPPPGMSPIPCMWHVHGIPACVVSTRPRCRIALRAFQTHPCLSAPSTANSDENSDEDDGA